MSDFPIIFSLTIQLFSVNKILKSKKETLSNTEQKNPATLPKTNTQCAVIPRILVSAVAVNRLNALIIPAILLTIFKLDRSLAQRGNFYQSGILSKQIELICPLIGRLRSL